MSNPETALQHRIMLALSQAGCLVFRNETAGAWVGQVIHQQGDIVTIRGARMLKAGLCVGSSDIIGLLPDGRFLAAEVKTATGRPSAEQLQFIKAIAAHSGIAGIVRSPEDALALIAKP